MMTRQKRAKKRTFNMDEELNNKNTRQKKACRSLVATDLNNNNNSYNVDAAATELISSEVENETKDDNMNGDVSHENQEPVFIHLVLNRTTTPEVAIRYVTPETTETPATRNKRRNNRRQAITRMRARRRLQEDADNEMKSSEVVDEATITEIANRYVTPEMSETPATRNKRRNNRRQAITRMRARRRLQQNGALDVALQQNAIRRMQQRNTQQKQIKYVALQYYEGYNENALKGKNIIDGRHKLLGMIQICEYCKSAKFPGETKGSCCNNGKVALLPFVAPPCELVELYGKPDFTKDIRKYNSVFSFTSMGAYVDRSLANDRDGVYTYRINGEVCHKIGSLLPAENHTPKFAQMYVFDSDMNQEIDARRSVFPDLKREYLSIIHGCLHRINPYVKQFRMAGEFARTSNRVVLRIKDNIGEDRRTHNKPTASEVAAVLVEDDGLGHPRDIVLHLRGGGLTRIFETKACYDPLQYPLLFPHGEQGWSPYNTYSRGNTSHHVSLREFIAYRLYFKKEEHSLLHRSGRLFQQYCVDQYAKVEQQRLKYQRDNQTTLRAELYGGLKDMVNGQRLSSIGKRIVLAPSFTGGPRYMWQQYQDSMAIVREFGKPDLFVTVTCNPKWPEITENLMEGQKAESRPDIVARVFKQKLKAIEEDILKKEVLGKVEARVRVIEFQKRGLPHAHMLLILCEEDKPRTPLDFNKFVSAEIPDHEFQPKLHETVATCMIHGPCGDLNPKAPCMYDKKCSKGFPKQFCNETSSGEDGYPSYMRRDNGRTIKRNGNKLDNRWVVPYNPYLSQKYNCHINIEVCSTVTAVKYLYKYVYKGSDRAIVALESVGQNAEEEEKEEEIQRDEIQEYLNARYISASESCWRLFEYPLQEKSHTVVHLALHLPNSNFVTFTDQEDIGEVLERHKHTTLTRFFDLCKTDSIAKTLLYHEVPCHFVWKDKNWVKRKRGHGKMIGRIYTCSPADIERYHLRVLLCARRGPKSFDDLLTVDGILYPTFKAAAVAAGLLEGDEEWEKCLDQAATFQMPAQMRQLFGTILVYCQPTDPKQLWDKHKKNMMEDFLHNADGLDMNNPLIMVKLVKEIDRILSSNGKNLTDFPTLPQLSEFLPYLEIENNASLNRVVASELAYNKNKLEQILSRSAEMNMDQKHVFDKIINSVCSNNPSKKLFFLDGPGGTGKSFVLEQIMAFLRLQGRIVLAVASSGIASLLLMGGRTAHSRFKIPIHNLTSTSTCSISKQSMEAELLKMAELIIWDEGPMMHKYAFESVDRMLQDIMENNHLFGGKVVLVAGDFRQTLPIVIKGTPGQIVNACLKKSKLWEHFELLELKTNMRIRKTETGMEEVKEFANFLLKLGEGRHDTCGELGDDYIMLPKSMKVQPSDGRQYATVSDLINNIYGEIKDGYRNQSYFSDRMLLTPTNIVVAHINLQVNERLPGEKSVYYSIDSVEDENDRQRSLFPHEFLNTLNLSGMPPHNLPLKVGSPIILLRNLQGERGLCNGTRLQIKRLQRNCIDAEIIHGVHKGTRVFIPRISLTSQNENLPFQLRRRQFPIQLAYAMTVNKAQGQSVNHVGLYLPQPVFSHGQLYVALSRVTKKSNVKVLVENSPKDDEEGVYTKNVVYRSILKN